MQNEPETALVYYSIQNKNLHIKTFSLFPLLFPLESISAQFAKASCCRLTMEAVQFVDIFFFCKRGIYFPFTVTSESLHTHRFCSFGQGICAHTHNFPSRDLPLFDKINQFRNP